MTQFETATLAGGCFWCTEAIFTRLKGVTSVVPGYAASNVPNPSYRAVCTGRTGAAEAIQIQYDPSIISYDTLLEVFWHLHDPTTLNRQGHDVGTQYRSAIFYHTEEQKQVALASFGAHKGSPEGALWSKPLAFDESGPLDFCISASNLRSKCQEQFVQQPLGQKVPQQLRPTLNQDHLTLTHAVHRLQDGLGTD